MTLAQRIVIASDDGRSVMALGLAALLLFGAIALLLSVGLRPAPAQASAPPVAAPVAKAAQDPACAAARRALTRRLALEHFPICLDRKML